MLDKLEDLKRQSEESNARLTAMEISEKSSEGEVEVILNGHRVLREIKLSEDFKKLDKSDQEDLLYQCFNKALEKVNKANEQEVMASAQSLFPGL